MPASVALGTIGRAVLRRVLNPSRGGGQLRRRTRHAVAYASVGSPLKTGSRLPLNDSKVLRDRSEGLSPPRPAPRIDGAPRYQHASRPSTPSLMFAHKPRCLAPALPWDRARTPDVEVHDHLAPSHCARSCRRRISTTRAAPGEAPRRQWWRARAGCGRARGASRWPGWPRPAGQANSQRWWRERRVACVVPRGRDRLRARSETTAHIT